MKKRPIVIALGGNAIKQNDGQGTTEEQLSNVDTAAKQIAGLVNDGYTVLVTHGNGPQAGNLLIQQECGEAIITSLRSAAEALQGKTGTRIYGKTEKAAAV